MSTHIGCKHMTLSQGCSKKVDEPCKVSHSLSRLRSKWASSSCRVSDRKCLPFACIC